MMYILQPNNALLFWKDSSALKKRPSLFFKKQNVFISADIDTKWWVGVNKNISAPVETIHALSQFLQLQSFVRELVLKYLYPV